MTRADSDGGRRPRGQLLIVGRALLTEPLRRQLRDEPLCVDNVFEAMGEITRASAGHPVVAAIVDGRLVNESALAALRRVDPSVRLLHAASNGTPAASDVDDRLAIPLEAGALRAALGAEWVLAPEATESTPRPAPDDTAAETPEPASGSIPGPRVSAKKEPAPADTTPDDTAPAAAGGLGDVDLVEAVLDDAGGLARTALALIRERTGWHDVALVSEEPPASESQTSAPVGPGGSFGHLTTQAAAARELERWSVWLAHWLALDASYRRYRVLAYRDDLTGAWNRRYFARFLDETIERARARRVPVTVMVFDIDDFKRYNDEFGHAAGDVILCETVALLTSVIRSCDRVCRIGGDEFAVIFADLEGPRETGSRHPESPEGITRRFQSQIAGMRFPKLGLEAPGNLSISAGLSSYPWDGDDPKTLLRLADQRALASKRKGKNAITFGPDSSEDR